MGENSESPVVPEEGELSNDSDTNDLFVIDSTPATNQNGMDVPLYEKKFDALLEAKSKEDGNDKPKRPKMVANKCWNCNGDHALRDCEEPRNYEAINHNRLKFMSKGPGRTKASRYHLDTEQKYPHIQPGKLSTRLQRALGLQSNQLPRHIYRMRVLGYPPGWVEEARVSHSGLSLFNSEGQEVADPGFEDGEIVAAGAKDKFDIKKIIEYPGFNCPCGPDIIDEHERLASKPMTEKDSIERMMVVWQPKAVKAYKRRKMNDSSGSLDMSTTSSKKRSLLLLDDMEIDSDDAQSSSEEGEISVEKKDSVQDCKGNIAASPEVQKRSASSTLDSPNPKRQKVKEEAAGSGENTEDGVECRVSSPVENRDVGNPSLPVTPNVGKVTSVCLGTPVIHTSPFTSLPSPEKFAKDICDVINFENLPDSTGKYEKMSGLIKKVRTFVSKLYSEDDNE